jgi:N-acetylmuramoyl-L-alanine amidase CwlA
VYLCAYVRACFNGHGASNHIQATAHIHDRTHKDSSGKYKKMQLGKQGGKPNYVTNRSAKKRIRDNQPTKQDKTVQPKCSLTSASPSTLSFSLTSTKHGVSLRAGRTNQNKPGGWNKLQLYKTLGRGRTCRKTL